ncbi:MAG: trigger factor [Deltaproteobacteria bacterium]|nr:trigger factor [Deltaproteobacteria bacterium]
MQLSIEDISPVEKRVDFEVPWGDVAPRLERAYSALRKQVKLHGFRPGKAPRSVLEKMYGPRVEDEVAREIIELSLGQAIEEKQIAPVAPPRVDKLELKAGQGFKFSALVEIKSTVVPKGYTGLELKRRPAKVDEAQIQQQLETHQRQLTQYLPIEEGRDVTKGDDLVLVEVTGKVGAHKIKHRTAAVDLSDPSREPLPGLAAQLNGISVKAEDHEVKYKIADDVPMRELAGQDVALKVTVKEVRSRKVPAIDDELAKDTGEAETLAGLKEKIRARLEDSDKQRIRAELSQQAVKALVKANDFPVARSMVERYAKSMVEQFKAQLARMGIEPGAAGIDDQRMFNDSLPEAETQARASVLLAAIAEVEKIEVTDADVQKKLAELAAARQENVKKLRADLEKSGQIHGLRRQIQDDKTLDLLLAQAKIADVSAEEAQQATEAGK